MFDLEATKRPACTPTVVRAGMPSEPMGCVASCGCGLSASGFTEERALQRLAVAHVAAKHARKKVPA